MAYWTVFLSIPVHGESDDWAEPLKKAISLQGNGEYRVAYELMLSYAEIDNGLAQFHLALHHDLGWSRERDEYQACYWYKKAAYNNIPLAMQKYADCLVTSVLPYTEEETALSWYKKAYQHGIYESGCAAGKLLITNENAKENDIDEGLRLCRASAESGSIDASLYLGELYYQGKLVEKNSALALKLFQLASPEKQPKAAFYIAKMFDQGIAIKQDIKQATYWYEIAASQGFGDAYLPLAALYWTLYKTSRQENERFLAKSYLWFSTYKLVEMSVSENTPNTLYRNIIEETPPQWTEKLDSLVTEHIQTFHASNAISLN